jgi:hypothetical protein
MEKFFSKFLFDNGFSLIHDTINEVTTAKGPIVKTNRRFTKNNNQQSWILSIDDTYSNYTDTYFCQIKGEFLKNTDCTINDISISTKESLVFWRKKRINDLYKIIPNLPSHSKNDEICRYLYLLKQLKIELIKNKNEVKFKFYINNINDIDENIMGNIIGLIDCFSKY